MNIDLATKIILLDREVLKKIDELSQLVREIENKELMVRALRCLGDYDLNFYSVLTSKIFDEFPALKNTFSPESINDRLID